MDNSPSLSDIQEQIKNIPIDSIVQNISNNPEQFTEMISEAMESITPEMKEYARKLSTTPQAKEARQELQKKGVSRKSVKKQLKKIKKEKKSIPQSLAITTSQKAVLITNSRKIKQITLSCANIELSVWDILHVSAPVELSCSRLAQGPLKGKTIKVWYDADDKSRNKLTSKIIGFPVGGSMIILVKDEDLTVDDFMLAKEAMI